MFKYSSKSPFARTFGSFHCGIKIFEPVKQGVILSRDFRSKGSNFIDYSADNLVTAGVDVAEPSKEFTDVSLGTLDNVEEQVTKIVESESLIVKSEN